MVIFCGECVEDVPTTNALVMRHVDVYVNCPWCHSGVETDGHVMFGCDFSRIVWQSSEVKSLVQFLPGEAAFDVFLRCFSACTRDQCVLIGMICWSIWNQRNKWVWGKVNGFAFGVLAAVRN